MVESRKGWSLDSNLGGGFWDCPLAWSEWAQDCAVQDRAFWTGSSTQPGTQQTATVPGNNGAWQSGELQVTTPAFGKFSFTEDPLPLWTVNHSRWYQGKPFKVQKKRKGKANPSATPASVSRSPKSSDGYDSGVVYRSVHFHMPFNKGQVKSLQYSLGALHFQLRLC